MNLTGKLLFVIISCFVTKSAIFCQSKNAVTFEAFGSSLIYSLNYEHHFGNEITGFGVRIGAGYNPWDGSNFFSIPIGANYLIGTGKHHLELGAGIVYYGGDALFLGDYYYENEMGGYLNIFYRYQKPTGGFIGKIGLSPIFSTDLFSSYAWFGATVGYSF